MNDDSTQPVNKALTPARAADITPRAHTVTAASGRTIEITEHGPQEQIHVRAPDGQLVLSIRMTNDGPILSLSGVSLEIAAQKHISLRSETLAIQASGDATLDIGGSLHEQIRGNAIREAGRASIERAREVKVEASPGGVAIVANDDVDIKGERVRLNSDDPPMPLTWDEHRARQAQRLTPTRDLPIELALPGSDAPPSPKQ